MDENAKQHITVKHISLSVTVEVPDPPPPEFISKFNTLEEWLFNICDGEKPEKPIATYEFGLSEGINNYTLDLVGLNKSTKSEYHKTILIEFEPKEMYFTIPVNEFKNLDREEVLEKLTCQLKDFTTTSKFRNSFLAEANSINTSFKGEIWTR